MDPTHLQLQHSVLGKRPRFEDEDARHTWSNDQKATRPDGSDLASAPAARQGPVSNAAQQAAGTAKKQGTPEFFMKSLHDFMRGRGTPITHMPRIGQTNVNLVALYGHVMKAGGSRMVAEADAWGKIAANLGMPGQQDGFRQIYTEYLAAYEEAWTAARRKQQPGAAHATPQPPAVTVTSNAPTLPQYTMANANTIASRPPSQDRSVARADSPAWGPMSGNHLAPKQEDEESLEQLQERSERIQGTVDETLDLDADLDATNITPFSLPDEQQTGPVPPARLKTAYRPRLFAMTTHASMELNLVDDLGHEIDALRPYPTFQEMGNVDVQALTRSLESGLPTEVGNALDVLVVIAGDRRWGLPLGHCRDLLEALLDVLSTSIGPPLSDSPSAAALLPPPPLSYRQMLDSGRRAAVSIGQRRSKHPARQLQAHVSSERILAVLTVIRNLSFTEVNQQTIAVAPRCAAILADTMALLSTDRLQIERRLELAKDLVTLLAHIASHLVLPSRQVARTFLHFLAAFAPELPKHTLPRYDSAAEPYLPSSIDAVAKLLCHNSSNCQLIRQELLGDLQSCSDLRRSLMYRMMTMALCPVTYSGDANSLHLLDSHLPLIEHALIVAENIADFCPIDGNLAASWLEDFTDLGSNLWRMAHLATGPPKAKAVDKPYALVAMKCSIVLRLLMEKGACDHASTLAIREIQAVGTLLLNADREMVENLSQIHRLA